MTVKRICALFTASTRQWQPESHNQQTDKQRKCKFKVVHSKSLEDARKCARAIAALTLVKCAMFGSYPAYPDIAGALGYSGADFRPGDFDIFIKNDIARVQLMRSSLKADFDKEAAEGILSGDSLTVVIDLKDGEASSMAWGCDMSTGYVRANAYLDT